MCICSSTQTLALQAYLQLTSKTTKNMHTYGAKCLFSPAANLHYQNYNTFPLQFNSFAN